MSYDIVTKLQPASWRGVKFPIIGEREYSFAHEQSKPRIILKDYQLIRSLGLENPGFSYRVLFDETLRTARWDKLFTEVYPQFLAACKDRTPGKLYDPVHGYVTAKCVQLAETLSTSQLYGVQVQVQFIEAPETTSTGQRPAEMPITAMGGLVKLGRRVDEEVTKVDWKQEPPPENNRDLFDSLQAFGDQVDLFQSNINGKLGSLSAKMDRATSTIDKLKDPKLGPTRQAVRRLQLSALALQETATTPPRPVDVVRKSTEIAKFAFASAYGMTVEELHMLNQSLQSVLLVPANEPVLVYRGR
jgi:hypothetical protein